MRRRETGAKLPSWPGAWGRWLSLALAPTARIIGRSRRGQRDRRPRLRQGRNKGGSRCFHRTIIADTAVAGLWTRRPYDPCKCPGGLTRLQEMVHRPPLRGNHQARREFISPREGRRPAWIVGRFSNRQRPRRFKRRRSFSSCRSQLLWAGRPVDGQQRGQAGLYRGPAIGYPAL